MLPKIILTSPLATGARRLTRYVGLNRLVSRLMRDRGYEERFGPELLKRVSAGDCVWDVGANVGFYTARFAEKAKKGAVVAFEPVGSCHQELVRRCGDWSQVIPVKVALGAEDGTALMEAGDDPLSTTNYLRPGVEGASAGCLTVEVRSAESFVTEHPELFPNVIKVDVEGYEGAVLDGMRGLLYDRRLHCVGFEVHFGILQERGESRRPREIHQAMEEQGFRVQWTDISHIIGFRRDR
jgi:FkbM family methyltransferase